MQTLSPSLHIGVLRGGPSSEYDVSLKTGANVLKHLSDTHRPIDIFISRDGKWHINGLERSPERILKNVDVVFNALHGSYGEDGQVQEVLNHLGVPYTGSGKMESAIAMNKWMTKERAILAGIRTPVAMLVRQTDSLTDKAKEIFNSMSGPMIVKPTCGGSSLGLYKANSFNELLSALETVLSEHGSAVVEEYIIGKEGTCGVIDDFRGQKTYSLPPVEIIPPTGKLFDYDSKYNGKSKEICPGNFSEKEKKEIERATQLIHNKLGLSHYSRSD
ncbi:MAG: hypothetical protein NTX96_03155 [Candidatus Zambryskibacteria bacterium]|nr:hypothetical protein [Candidatus Zambryskibacteria bacterium]